MAIRNYTIDLIDAKVEKRGGETVDVKESFSITDVKKVNNQIAEVGWSFNIDYKNLGKLAMEGTLMFFSDNLSQVTEDKEVKGKKMLALKGDALKEVSTFVLRRGIIEAILIAKTLQLPAPIQLPAVKVQPKKKG